MKDWWDAYRREWSNIRITFLSGESVAIITVILLVTAGVFSILLFMQAMVKRFS